MSRKLFCKLTSLTLALALSLVLAGCSKPAGNKQGNVGVTTTTGVGQVATGQSQGQALAERPPGWSEVGGPGPLSVFSLLDSNGTLSAGTSSGVWSWNGSAWSQVGGANGLTGDAKYVSSLAVYNGTLYAGTSGAGLWSWNGSAWSQVGGGSGPNVELVEYINDLLVSNDTLYVATNNGVWSWNGSN
jgi:hypothetical protein